MDCGFSLTRCGEGVAIQLEYALVVDRQGCAIEHQRAHEQPDGREGQRGPSASLLLEDPSTDMLNPSVLNDTVHALGWSMVFSSRWPGHRPWMINSIAQPISGGPLIDASISITTLAVAHPLFAALPSLIVDSRDPNPAAE